MANANLEARISPNPETPPSAYEVVINDGADI